MSIASDAADLDEEELQQLYTWVDEIPLSRPKRNIARDFADGVLAAEVVAYHFPRMVELHNYSAAHAHSKKMYNWETLSKKVLKRLGFQLTHEQIADIVASKPGVVEQFLRKLRKHMARYRATKASKVGSGSRSSPETHGTPASLRSPAMPSPRKPAAHRQPPQAGGGAAPYDIAAPQATGSVLDTRALQRQVDAEILIEKEQQIHDLRETVDILELKVKKLEQLVRLKDSKIQALTARLAAVSGDAGDLHG